ncbi:MAG: alpha/beta fold hydrolase [Actinobacteria bacterium]|nr:alpha/beta fold hydrolase [Actinomycetota bacterium]
MSERIECASIDGLTLEAELDTAEEANATLLLCHPHPQMGGTMNAPLLLAIRDGLVARRWNVLRFNFRGIGASQGESSTGTAEVQDAFGALERARSLGVPVAVAGWSFGAAVALRVAGAEDDLLACVAIAPSIDPKPGITEGVPADVAPRCPVLVVTGANDDQTSPESARGWAAEHGATFEELPGANHFFWAKYEQLTTLVVEWLEERV